MAGFLSRSLWLPRVEAMIANMRPDPAQPAAHDPGADPQQSSTSLQLSEQARKNVGLELVSVEQRDFDRTINVPAMVIERPGQTQLEVASQMTGIVTRIYPIRGEAVSPGEQLFELRLTHQDLVATQSAFLQTLEQLDVIDLEAARLEKGTSTGFIPEKRLLEQQYQQKLTEARRRAQRQGLLLHGLSKAQVDNIETTRQLLEQVTILAPPLNDCESCRAHEEFFQVAELAVSPGEHVSAGARLCTLTDHCELYVEGKAFEQDAHALNEAAKNGAPVTAVVEGNGSGPHGGKPLRILYVENQVDVETRALKFYVRLPNELIRNEVTEDGHRFIGWRYKPGQRVELLVPVQRWENRIVLPVEAVVQEGVEWFVYRQAGGRFDRKSVHVEYRDQHHVVIENDGTLFPGDVVAGKGAYQIHLALKNKAGGGVDPHAGHNH